MATDPLADLGIPMPHRLLHLPVAPVFGVVGAAVTGVCTLVGTAAHQGQALFAVAADSPAVTGWWGGLLLAVGAAVVSIYKGISEVKAGERQVLLAKVLELTQEVGQLRGERVDLLAKIEHLNNNVKHGASLSAKISKHTAEVLDDVASRTRKTEVAVKKLAESSGVGLDTADMPTIPDAGG